MTPAERTQLVLDRLELSGGVLVNKLTQKPAWVQLDKDGYLRIRLRVGRTCYSFGAHRLMWFFHYGEWPKHTIDHINRDKTDNRIENLRDVTLRENCQNRQGARADGCVSWRADRGRWMARITVGGKRRWVGTFQTKHEAIAALAPARRMGVPAPVAPCGTETPNLSNTARAKRKRG